MGVSGDVEKSLAFFFKKYPDICTQNSYAVAVSGGPDSMALLHALYIWSKEHHKTLHVLTVNHGLRPEARDEADQVSAWVVAQKSDHISHAILTWDDEKPETSVLEVARHARYNLMADYCESHNIGVLFVAHHQDDQAETFLIRLAKGSGLDGLAAMEDVHDFHESLQIVRPFLTLSKQDLVSYCDNNSIHFVADPSNKDDVYLRPRLRRSMAVLEEEGLSAKRLSTLTRRLRRARQALENITEKAYAHCLKGQTEKALILDFDALRGETEEIALRTLQKAISNLRQEGDYGVRMDRLENLFESLWHNPAGFKPRTLGGLLFALRDKNSALYIEQEHSKKE